MNTDARTEREALELELKAVLASSLGEQSNELNLDAPFSDIGVNSIVAVEFIEALNLKLGTQLGIELIFDYNDITSLANYLRSLDIGSAISSKQEMILLLQHILSSLLQETNGELPDARASFGELGVHSVMGVEFVEEVNCKLQIGLGFEVIYDYDNIVMLTEHILHTYGMAKSEADKMESNRDNSSEYVVQDSDIAIIGISGRYAGSENIHEFWTHLQEGDDCIRVIDRSGWEQQSYYDSDPTQENKSVSKWGGLLSEIDSFDPLFFHISPAEAERMDPQQRLFLEETYKAVEDSGHSSEQLAGKKVGVFVGGRSSDYKERTLEGEDVSSQTFLGNDMAILAGRISYFMNFKGPSLAIDTACSSALVAVHLACESIRREESEIAIAGGVFILSSPEFYVMTSKTNMLSADGKCKTFDDSANGIVVGEGVGVVVLKSLKHAMADGDHIYGVIKGSAINQDGKTKGITAPSMLSQKALLCEAYEKSDIDPGTISYIEAHGTGTKLGDPIEVKALSEAFSLFTDKKQYCAIGSHKPNFGHTIMSAGIAGMLKVLMAMKHKQIPPTIHVQQTNRHIDFEESPFYLNTELIEWTPVEGYPLRAGISSFGFSGTNCHMILEEAPKDNGQKNVITNTAHLFPLSAKTKVALRQKVEDMIEWLYRESGNFELSDIAYTLQQGRSHFPFRLAVVAESTNELLERLKDIAAYKDDLNDTGIEAESGEAFYTEVEDLQQLTPDQYRKMLNELAAQYSRQYNPEWERLYKNQSRSRVPLPVYPFSKQHFWAPVVSSSINERRTSREMTTLHPLMHQNSSTLNKQRYTSLFDGEEFFLKDHVIQGRRVLPGVAYLEMARVAIEQATNRELGHEGIVLKNITWSRPFMLEDEPVQIHIDLYPEENGDISFEIFSENGMYGEDTILHAQGSAISREPTIHTKLDIKDLINQSEDLLLSRDCYESFHALGFAYGPSHKGVEYIYKGKDYVVGKVVLPRSVMDTQEQFILHPSVMDAAFQLTLAFNLDISGALVDKDKVNPILPFALNELELLSSCTSTMWAYVRYSEGSQPGDKVEKMEILLCDEDGTICVSMKGLTSRRTNAVLGESTSTSSSTIMMYPTWREQPITITHKAERHTSSIIVLCELADQVHEKVARLMIDSEFIVLQSSHQEFEQRFEAYAVQIFERLKTIISEKTSAFMQIVVPLDNEKQLFSAFSSLLKTAALEWEGFTGQIIETDDWKDTGGIVRILKENSYCNDSLIRYQNGSRMIRDWKKTDKNNEHSDVSWKDNGVYLITGGNGGLGRIFVKEIIRQCISPTIVLIGKSALSLQMKAQHRELEELGSKIEYLQVDVTDKTAVMDLIRGIRQRYGKLNGIIHGAGIIRDSLIMNKDSDEFKNVVAPKVTGLMYLDEAAREEPIDFFVVFSSLVGIMGNIGQADYATANAFMDAYVTYRNGLRNQHHMLSINWPLWKEGGMQVDEVGTAYLFQKWGMKALNTTDGLEFFHRARSTSKDQIMIVSGDAVRFKQKLLEDSGELNIRQRVVGNTIGSSTLASSIATNEELIMKVKTAFVQSVSNLLKVDANNIDNETELTDYGFDSITFTQMTNKLNQLYNLELSPTLFFEYPTIQQYVTFLISEYSDHLTSFFHVKAETTVVAPKQNEQTRVGSKQPRFKREDKRRFNTVYAGTEQELKQQDNGKDGIAIVGISGIFPMADDVEAFWENLVQGKDCISEIPVDRWDWRAYYGDPMIEANKMNCRWGGFINGVDEFDPLFFGISPKEAELMDPQQRLLMTYVWKAIEDAGYSAQSLSGTNTGIFAGTTASGYNDLLLRANITIEGYSSTGMVPSVGPNRMSYFLNVHGPSEPIETACSSSLVAIHRAVRAIQSGDCEMAIAGGINTIVSPELQISFSKAGMLCEGWAM
ncbi:SDR family NAD(P)-dependent oxidoreductase (plasmid) [Bacillus thuringiensis]|nr:SDR family NAD(P)-dependent oxidoreductase [Bacillus thuringiensis]QFQ28662.1 SDR family NAD(P)-dependent oxidoreductase [Bacillus thuringiensis]